MTDAKTELSYYAHCAALLFLAGLRGGIMQDVTAHVPKGKISFSCEISHNKLKGSSI